MEKKTSIATELEIIGITICNSLCKYTAEVDLDNIEDDAFVEFLAEHCNECIVGRLL